MATAILIPPAFSGLDPVNGAPAFWSVGPLVGQWTPVGDSDIGVDLQAIDANTVNASQDGSSGVNASSAIYFEDSGAIPAMSGIQSVTLVINFDVIGVDMTNAESPFNLQWGAGAGNAVPLVGANTDDFTGSGTFISAVMTINPSTGVDWTYDDLYGQPLPFSDPHGFQGWWGINCNTGSGSDPTTAQYNLNYVALSVEYGGTPSVTPTNWTMDAVFVHSGKGTREFGMRRKT